MANKNFKVRNGLDIGDGLSISDTATFTTTSNGNITLAPNGSGDIIFTLADGGNLTNSRNYVFGAIRNATTEGLGDIWAGNTTGTVAPYRGVNLDNSQDTTRGPGTILRSYSGGAVNGSTTRGRVVFEKARGTAAAPTAVQLGDLIGSVDFTGYTSTGWFNDTQPAAPTFYGITAAENWVSNTNVGTTFILSMAPTATTVTSSANLVNVIQCNPQTLMIRSDFFAIGRGKTAAFTATGCSVSGTTLTIGTVTSGTVAVGQLIQNSLSTFPPGAYIVSGSGSTWTTSVSLSGPPNLTVTGNTGFIGSPAAATTVDALSDLRLLTNNIKGSSGTTQIVTSASGTTLELRGNNIQLEDAAGTSIVGNGITYNRVYGQFEYNTTVTPAATNTAYVFPLGSAVSNNIATVASTSRLIPGAAGVYNIQFSAQVKNDNSQEHTAYIFLVKNGTAVTNSTGQVTILRQSSQIVSWNYLITSANTTDYWEIGYAVDNVQVTFPAFASTAFAPSAASIITTITPVGA